MSSNLRRTSHLSRHLTALRLQKGLRPAQLAAHLGASNVSKVGGVIRSFELGEPLCEYWLDKLIAGLQPDPAELRRCLELDQAEAEQQLERDRVAWEAWADEPIDPYLWIRYMPAVYGVREVPRAFCTPRATAEDNAWARARAEDWAADELKRFSANGHLNWSRRERTWYDQRGLNPRRVQVTFEERSGGSWMQVQGSAQKFLLGSNGQFTTKGPGLDQPC